MTPLKHGFEPILGIVGLQVVPTGRAAVLAYTTPLWVAPGASLLLGERLTGRKAVGVAVGLAGLVVLFDPFARERGGRTVVLGSLAVIGAALLWRLASSRFAGTAEHHAEHGDHQHGGTRTLCSGPALHGAVRPGCGYHGRVS